MHVAKSDSTVPPVSGRQTVLWCTEGAPVPGTSAKSWWEGNLHSDRSGGRGSWREQSPLKTRWGLTCAPQAALEPWPSFRAAGHSCGRPTQGLPPRPALGTLALPLSSEVIKRTRAERTSGFHCAQTGRADAVEARADGGGGREGSASRARTIPATGDLLPECATVGHCGPKSLWDLSLLGRLAEDQDTFRGPRRPKSSMSFLKPRPWRHGPEILPPVKVQFGEGLE